MRSFDSEGHSVLLAQCHLPGEVYDGAVTQAVRGDGVPMVISGDQETGTQFVADMVIPPFSGEKPTLVGSFLTRVRMPEGDVRETRTPAIAKAELPNRSRRLMIAIAGLPLREVRLSIWSDMGILELPQEA